MDFNKVLMCFLSGDKTVLLLMTYVVKKMSNHEHINVALLLRYWSMNEKVGY